MATTAKGFVSSVGTADNINEDAIKALADRMDAILTAKTQAAITALATTDLWTGRTTRATDATGSTTRQQSGLYIYDGANWVPGVGDDQPSGISGAPTLTATPTSPAMGTSPTLRWDWWLLGGFYCVGHIEIVWGTGAPTPGSGSYRISLPRPFRPWATPALASQNVPLGGGIITDSSGGPSVQYVTLVGTPIVNTSTAALIPASGTTVVSGASPLTLGAAGDSIRVDFSYFCT